MCKRHPTVIYSGSPSIPALCYVICLALVLSLVHSNSLAAPPTTEEQIQKRQDDIFRERQRNRLEPVPEVRLEPDVEELPSDQIPENETPCFILREIRLEAFDKGKNDKESAQLFQWALDEVLYPNAWLKEEPEVSPILGRCYGAQGINAIMRKVQNIIIRRGYVTTRIVAGPQDLKSGTLLLTVIPGRINKLKSDDRDPHLLPLEEGAILNLRHIEQALESLKRLPSVQADIQIVPAEDKQAQAGESDLIITWQQSRPWRAGLSVDDSGAESTGATQGTLSFAYDDLANMNDSLTMNFGHDLGDAEPGDGGTESYYINYSFPVKWLTLSFTASENEYFQTVSGAFTDSEFRGVSRNYQMDLSLPLYRDNRRKITGGFGLWRKRSNNFVDDFEISIQYRKVEGYTASVDYRQFIGSAILNASTSFRKAMDTDDIALELQANKVNPRPVIITNEISIDAPWSLAEMPFRYFGQWRQQNNLGGISSQDYFTIGNRYNVRTGTESSSLSAERGWFVRNDIELLYGAPEIVPYVGLDHGRVNGESFRPDWDELTAGVIGIKGRVQRLSYEFNGMYAIDEPDGFRDGGFSLQFSLNWQL